MLGSWAAEPVAVCDVAVPLRLHSNAVDRIAIAESATKLDDDLMTISRQIQDGHSVPMRTRYHTHSTSQLRIWPLGVETISGDDPLSTLRRSHRVFKNTFAALTYPTKNAGDRSPAFSFR